MIKPSGNQPPRMMAAAAGPSREKTRLGGLAASVSRHAESLIAISLIGVCIVVGAAAWLLKVRDEKSDKGHAAATAAVATESAPAEEASTGVAWAEELEGEMAEIEQRRLQDEQAQQQKEQARREAELAKRAQQAAKAPAAAPAKATAPAPAPVVVAAAAPAVTRARLDWKSCRQPDYPSSSYQRREEGTVVMSFEIDSAGKVLSNRIDQSSGSRILDRTAANAIAKCHFSPATAGGKPQASWAQVRFSWKLDS